MGSDLPQDNSHVSCVLVLLMPIDIVLVVLVLILWRGDSTPPFISKGAMLKGM
jgi:hypothetical protein